MCWRSNASTVEEGDTPFPNPLNPDFKLAGEVKLLEACPSLNSLTALAPPEFQRGERLRTGQVYNYSVSVRLNLESLSGGDSFVSDNGAVVAVQILVCRLGGGFCSPFIHEEANGRLQSQGIFDPPGRGDSHGGTHTHSRYQLVQVPPEDGPQYDLNIEVPMLVNDAGEYFAIAAVQMYLGDAPEDPPIMRYDMANALVDRQRLIVYQEPLDVLTVSDTVLLISYIAIGLVSSVILYLLVETIKNRDHQVLQLTQGSFLIVFLLAALTVAVSSLLFEPKNDFYCQASFPIVLTSGHLLYAITLGRLWRINAVISPLLAQTLKCKEKGWSHRLMNGLAGLLVACTRRDGSSQKLRKLRTQVAPCQLAALVGLVTLPQVVIQALSIGLQPSFVTIDLNEDQSTGRVICEDGEAVGSSLQYYGIWTFLLLVVMLLCMAQSTSRLPSLFNETRVIYESAVFTLVLLSLGSGVLIVTNDPTTTPAITYLVCVAWSLSIALNTSLRIMMPKLQMVWRNEKIVVSTLISDHARSLRKEGPERKISGLSPPTGLSSMSSQPSSGVDTTYSANSQVHAEDDEEVTPAATEAQHGSSTEGEPPETPVLATTVKTVGSPRPRRNYPNGIVVASDSAPSRILTLKMLDLKEQLASVTERICSGMVVSEDEWANVRDLTEKLGSTFHDDVVFAWEKRKRNVEAQEGDVQEHITSTVRFEPTIRDTPEEEDQLLMAESNV